jgi:hypothetical protein
MMAPGQVLFLVSNSLQPKVQLGSFQFRTPPRRGRDQSFAKPRLSSGALQLGKVLGLAWGEQMVLPLRSAASSFEFVRMMRSVAVQ